jgi:hypothetical protein
LNKLNAPSTQDETIIAQSATAANLSQRTKKHKDAPKDASKGGKKPNKKPEWMYKKPDASNLYLE